MPNILARFRRDGKGLAAVEFAFVAPVMLTFFFGLIEVSQALLCRSNVTNLASTAADLVSQESSASSADLSNVYGALAAMLFPYPTAPAKITISSLVDNNTGTTATVAWSCTHGGTARAVNSVVTLPPTPAGQPYLIAKGGGGSVILAEVSYNYSSTVSSYFVGSVTMANSFYAKPRLVAKIPLSGACP